MPKLHSEFKEQIKSLTKTQLEEIVMRVSAKHKVVYDYLVVNYFEKEFGERDLFEEARKDIKMLFSKNYKGFSQQLKLALMIEACVKRINEFQKICKSKNLEADLILMVLDEVFTYSHKLFGTCFTKYDYKTGLLLKRLITLVTSKMHPDYIIEYRDKINEYLQVLHITSDHVDSIHAMPTQMA